MKKAIRFIIGAIALEYSLVAACYMDCDGAIGDMAAMYFWSELDRKRAELDKRIKRIKRRRMRENVW